MFPPQLIEAEYLMRLYGFPRGMILGECAQYFDHLLIEPNYSPDQAAQKAAQADALFLPGYGINQNPPQEAVAPIAPVVEAPKVRPPVSAKELRRQRDRDRMRETRRKKKARGVVRARPEPHPEKPDVNQVSSAGSESPAVPNAE